MTPQTATALQTFSVECIAPVDGPVRAARAHERLETQITVLEGVVAVASDEHDWILTPGDELTIPAGRAFRRWNAGDDEARLVEVYRVAGAPNGCPEAAALIA
jgi:uncharacterized cupin superfamily protein